MRPNDVKFCEYGPMNGVFIEEEEEEERTLIIPNSQMKLI